MGSEMCIRDSIVPFLISTAVGAVIAGAVVFSLQRSGALRSMQNSLS